MLRRVKDDQAIAMDLPDKKEIKCYVSLTPEQSLLYEQQLDILFGRIERAVVDGKKRKRTVYNYEVQTTVQPSSDARARFQRFSRCDDDA